MQPVALATSAGPVSGAADARFAAVVDAFAGNFEKRGEVGASLCITLEGKPVVDVWGGRKTPDGDPWERDTVSIVFSCTKGASALAAHMAADRGLLDLDAPVARYWPEFAQAGKEGARVRMMLDHSVGLPHVRGQRTGFRRHQQRWGIKNDDAVSVAGRHFFQQTHHGITHQ